jgi:hypothetical protein
MPLDSSFEKASKAEEASMEFLACARQRIHEGRNDDDTRALLEAFALFDRCVFPKTINEFRERLADVGDGGVDSPNGKHFASAHDAVVYLWEAAAMVTTEHVLNRLSDPDFESRLLDLLPIERERMWQPLARTDPGLDLKSRAHLAVCRVHARGGKLTITSIAKEMDFTRQNLTKRLKALGFNVKDLLTPFIGDPDARTDQIKGGNR